MATKPTKPTLPSASPPQPRSPAKIVQAQSKTPPVDAVLLPVTLRLDNSFEYHMDLPQPVIEGILDPDVPDVFIEVQCPVKGTRRFLHTAFVKEIDVRGMA